MSQTNAQKFVARGQATKRGRPRKAFVIEPSEWAFLDEPPQPKRHFGKSASNPGRYCHNINCREYVGDMHAPCPHCWSAAK